jgi:hypothetical protein
MEMQSEEYLRNHYSEWLSRRDSASVESLVEQALQQQQQPGEGEGEDMGVGASQQEKNVEGLIPSFILDPLENDVLAYFIQRKLKEKPPGDLYRTDAQDIALILKDALEYKTGALLHPSSNSKSFLGVSLEAVSAIHIQAAHSAIEKRTLTPSHGEGKVLLSLGQIMDICREVKLSVSSLDQSIKIIYVAG